MSFLLSFFLISYAQAGCKFPESAKIIAAESIGANRISIIEQNTQCLYFISPENENGPKILWAKPLTEVPSDLKWHKGSNRLFFYYPIAAELHSVDLNLFEEKIEATIASKEECNETSSTNIEIKHCVSSKSYPFKIIVGEKLILLSYHNSLLATHIDTIQFKSLYSFGWEFNKEFSYHTLSNRLLLLQNQPAGESLVYWYYVNEEKIKILSPVPATYLLSSGVNHLYFLEDNNFFLTDSGLVYRTNDFELVANINQSFDTAFMLGDKFITVKAQEQSPDKENIYKTTVYNSYLKAISFDYFFQAPIFITKSITSNSFIYLLPTGSLSEIFNILPIRSQLRTQP